MEYTYMSVFDGFSYMSILLIIAQFMRAKIKFLQNFLFRLLFWLVCWDYFLGPQFLGLIPWSGSIGSYAYMLVCVLFAGLFLGKKEKINMKTMFHQVGDSFCVNMAAEFICFGSALLIGRSFNAPFISKCVSGNFSSASFGFLRGTRICFNYRHSFKQSIGKRRLCSYWTDLCDNGTFNRNLSWSSLH